MLALECVGSISLMCRYEGDKVQVTATAGTAAVLVDGITIHSALGLGRANLPADQLHREMPNPAKDRWRKVKAHVVEEYSLLSSKVLTLVDALGKLFKLATIPTILYNFLCAAKLHV